MSNIKEIKIRYTIIDAWHDLRLPSEPGLSCHSPFPEEHKHKDSKKSFSVYGNDQRWKNHATGECGDVFNLVAKAQNCGMKEAIKWVKERLGIYKDSGKGSNFKRRSLKPIQYVPSSVKIIGIPQDCHRLWVEGRNFLHSQSGCNALFKLDQERGWQQGTSEILLDDGLLSMPLIFDERVIAFPVQYPDSDGWQLVGFHYCLNDKSWRYLPNEKQYGARVPSVPFILGAGYFKTSKLVIVLEGQWDAVCFASTAGWLHGDTCWPENVVVIGTRGVNGWQAFMQHWRSFWPQSAKFLLITDNDKAGRRWNDTFGRELQSCAHTITILRPAKVDEKVKDFSDLNMKKKYTSAALNLMLKDLELVN